MNTAMAQPRENRSLVALFGLISALLVIGVLTNVTVQMGIGDRIAFIGLVILGLAMCGTGKLGLGAVYGWANPLHLVGYVLGALGLILTAFVLLSVPVPYIATDRAAIIALSILMLVKVGVAQLYRK